MIDDNSAYAIFKGGCAKIHDETQAEPSELEIGQNLLGMDRMGLFDRFQLKDKLVFYQQIYDKRFLNRDVIVCNVDRHLPINPKTICAQPFAQNQFISRFQQPRPQRLVQFEPCIDDVCSDGFNILQTPAPSRLRVFA